MAPQKPRKVGGAPAHTRRTRSGGHFSGADLNKLDVDRISRQTRSGRHYFSTLGTQGPPCTPHALPRLLPTKLDSQALMQAAYEVEDANAGEREDDAEGAPLSRSTTHLVISLPKLPAADLFPDVVLQKLRPQFTTPTTSTTPPAALPPPPRTLSVEERRRKDQTRVSKSKKRIELAKSGVVDGGYKLRPGKQRGKHLTTMAADVDVADFPTAGEGAFIGRRVPLEGDDGLPWTEAKLDAHGFSEIPWTDGEPLAVIDNEERLFIVFVRKPAGSSLLEWDAVCTRAHKKMVDVRERGVASGAFTAEEFDHRRGAFLALNVGVSFGGGPTEPGNFHHSPKVQPYIAELLEDPDIRRIAGWQSSGFAYYFPKVFCHLRVELQKLYEQEGGLVQNFANSVYPATAFNCGPKTACKLHADENNVARMPCAVTATGAFDASKGAKVILWSIKKYIAVPHGATYWIPSATVPHGNTPIGDSEARGSITQFCAGGLLRYVAYGFTSIKKLLRQRGGAAKKAVFDGPPGAKAQAGIALYSKAAELKVDQKVAFGTS